MTDDFEDFEYEEIDTPDSFEIEPQQLTVSSIRLSSDHLRMIRELIEEKYDGSFPSYCDKVGIKPPNFYNVIRGERPCSLDFLNKLLSGIGYQVTINNNLQVRRYETGETVEDVNSALPDNMWLSKDVEEADEFD